MSFQSKTLVTGAAVYFALSSAAFAGAISWDLTGSPTTAHTFNVTSTNGLLSVEFTGWTGLPGSSADISRNLVGFGVVGGSEAQIDNANSTILEFIAIKAPVGGWQDIVLGIAAINTAEQFIVFGSATADASLFGPGNLENLFGPGAQIAGGPSEPDFYSLPVSASNWAYIIVGVGTGEVASGFRIASVDANVPEPGTLFLIGTALAGLGLMRRRRAR